MDAIFKGSKRNFAADDKHSCDHVRAFLSLRSLAGAPRQSLRFSGRSRVSESSCLGRDLQPVTRRTRQTKKGPPAEADGRIEVEVSASVI